MNTLGYAGLRFPLAISLGLYLTAGLFTVLWSFTDVKFAIDPVSAVPIRFTRTVLDTPPESRREPKVEREPPPIVEDLPPITGPTETGVETTVAVRFEPTVAIGPTGINVAGTDRTAIPLVRVEPTYPPREAARGIEGWVRVQFDIAASGSVTNVITVESEPGTAFDKAAMDAVARWRYSPSVVNGQAVARVGVQTLIRFTLEDE
jgi:protein TonB